MINIKFACINKHFIYCLKCILAFVQKPLGMHHIRTKLYAPAFSKLHSLYKSCLDTSVTDPNSIMYRLTAVVMDIANHRLFKPVTFKKEEKEKRSFLKLLFANKGLDAINLSNILHQNQSNLKFHLILKISLYQSFHTPIATKIFNYKHVLKNLSMDDYKFKPPDCI